MEDFGIIKMSKVTKDPKKVEAGKKGYRVKLAKMKEQILQEESTLPSTLPSTSGSTGTTSGTNLLSTSSIFLGGVGVLVVAFGVYFYMKPNRKVVQLVEKHTTAEEHHKPMV